jgi:hypothetical protein
MRAFLHEIGEAYGFIALGIALNIDIDFTLATSFDLTRMRRTKSCAKASPRATRSSGEAGDTGPAGTYVNWNQHDWKPGKPSCANDARYDERLCEQQITFSPNYPDDTGAMMAQPATVDLQQDVEDNVVGCGRIRVSFNCSRFSFEACIDDLVHRDIPAASFRDAGGRKARR